MSDYVKKINSKEIAASEVVPGSSLETKINSVTGGAVVKATIRTGGADQTPSFAKIVIDTTKTEFGYIKFRLTVIGTNYTANAGTESASVDVVIKISPKDNTFFSIVERTVRSDGEAGLIGTGVYWQNGSTIYLGMRTSSYYGRVAVEVIECYGVDNIFTYEIGNFDSIVSSMPINDLSNRTSAFSVANNGAGASDLPVYAQKNGKLTPLGRSLHLPTDGNEAEVRVGTDTDNYAYLDATPTTGSNKRGVWTVNNGEGSWLTYSDSDGNAHVGYDSAVSITNATGWRSTTKCYVGGIPVNGYTYTNSSTAHTIFYFGKMFGNAYSPTTNDIKDFTAILTVSTLENLNSQVANRASGFTAIIQINARQATERHVTINIIADDNWPFEYIPTIVCNTEDEDGQTLYRYGICFMDDSDNLQSFTYTKFDIASLCDCRGWMADRWFSSTSKLNTMTFFGGERRLIIRDRRSDATYKNAYISVRNSADVYTNMEAWDNNGDVKCGIYAKNGGVTDFICYKASDGKNYFNGTASSCSDALKKDASNVVASTDGTGAAANICGSLKEGTSDITSNQVYFITTDSSGTSDGKWYKRTLEHVVAYLKGDADLRKGIVRTSKGSSSQPIYVDSSGYTQPCNMTSLTTAINGSGVGGEGSDPTPAADGQAHPVYITANGKPSACCYTSRGGAVLNYRMTCPVKWTPQAGNLNGVQINKNSYTRLTNGIYNLDSAYFPQNVTSLHTGLPVMIDVALWIQNATSGTDVTAITIGLTQKNSDFIIGERTFQIVAGYDGYLYATFLAATIDAINASTPFDIWIKSNGTASNTARALVFAYSIQGMIVL